MVDHVDLFRNQRGDLGCRIVAEVDDFECVQMRAAAPVAAFPGNESRSLADVEFHHFERTGAVAAHLEFAILARVHDHEGIMEEGLGNTEIGCLAIQPYRKVIDFLDRVGIP